MSKNLEEKQEVEELTEEEKEARKLERKKQRYKRYMRLNIMSLFFAAVSFISITLAWFAYSGLITGRTEVDVKAWYIEFRRNGVQETNSLTITVPAIYPGMEKKSETVNIKNLGDSDASISYDITSIRILDKTITSNGQPGYVEDLLAHNYPFQINMSLSDKYANANDGTGEFYVSVDWPLDGGDNENDSKWGNEAYQFNKNNPDTTAIEITIQLKAEQYLGDNDSSDPDYRLGSIVLFNPTDNKKCSYLGDGCIKTYVIDKNSTIGDTSVTLLPDLNTLESKISYTEFLSQKELIKTKYKASTKALQVEDILPVVSKDINDTITIRPGLSPQIVGYLDYGQRVTNHIAQTIGFNGIYRYKTLNFPYLTTSSCIWLDTAYNETSQFALAKLDDEYTKLYNESINSSCVVVPVFEVAKDNLK